MSRNPINHPAFPLPAYAGDDSNPPVRSNTGMSIRDYFATAALSKLVSEKNVGEAAGIAEDAYAFADAMLEERQYNQTRK